MTRQPPGDGLLEVNCTCEAAVVLATPRQIRDGVPMSCGREGCPGTDPHGRVKRGPGRPLLPIAHGTVNGYRAHLRRRVPPCPACREANTRACTPDPTRGLQARYRRVNP